MRTLGPRGDERGLVRQRVGIRGSPGRAQRAVLASVPQEASHMAASQPLVDCEAAITRQTYPTHTAFGKQHKRVD